MDLSTVKEIIAESGFCKINEIHGLRIMKAGMTNHSYSFWARGQHCIVRIPGEGTEKLINRRQEYDVYNIIDPLGISEHVHYFNPVSGMKIASYLDDARSCDAGNQEDVQNCMAALRRFHSRKLSVSHTFDLWERIDFYESLWNGAPSCFDDYKEIKNEVLALRSYIEKQERDYVLCHIDSVPDNFMFMEHQDGNTDIKLIDWEYAGMQDPHLDIAMFAVYAMYDRRNIDAVIDSYFTEGCSPCVRMKIYCYIAVSGLLWSNWCEFKRHCGVEFGAYAQRQYQYAREYAAIFRDAYRKEFGVTYG